MPAIEYSANGLYSLFVPTGIIAAGLAAGSEIFQFRNNQNTKKIKILYVGLQASVDATGFTAGSAVFDMVKASSWSVAGTGGTAITLDSGSKDHVGAAGAQQVDSLIAAGDIRVATTGALGAGTKTLASNAASGVVTSAGAAGQVMLYPADILYVDGPDYIPLTLGNQEGFVLRATVPATGTWKAGVQVVWSELAQ